ncbi:hypothetical protein L6452_40459 [Arctium lappa]|uniref:Uncharacterized protein n=1 Tax=Arctium lappa TaxID=4217 RepID=A0ACB8XM01_ARCLA|nr:hypothetical protein L6452_40459 [Arctium lappa]
MMKRLFNVSALLVLLWFWGGECKEFGQKPRVGWQIDPFGHSSVQAYLMGVEVGFDSLFFARMDYQDRAKRKSDKTLEVVWQASRSLGSSSQLFTGIFPRHYDPPDGFKFEINDVSPPIQAARQLEIYKGRSSSRPNTDALANALAIAQHHDAVSGTQRQHVAAEYAMRISMAM